MSSSCLLTGKHLIVTGGAGFIGSHLVRRLTDEHANVTVLTKEGSALWRLAQAGCCCRIAAADIIDEEAVARIFRDSPPDGVFHLAAYGVDSADQDIKKAVSVNVGGMVNVLKAMKSCGCPRAVVMGSGAEYGNHPGPIEENAPLHPGNVYASTKAAATLIAHQFATSAGIGIVTLRPFGVYGEAEPRHKIFCHAILSMLREEPLDLTPCTQCRDYCYVGDIVDAAVAAFQNETLQNAVFNLGTGCARPLRDYIEQIRAVIQPSSSVNFGALPFRPHELWAPVPDVRLAAEQLHWRSRYSLEEGLQKTVNWFRENGQYYDETV